jgi:hypothetical protein
LPFYLSLHAWIRKHRDRRFVSARWFVPPPVVMLALDALSFMEAAGPNAQLPDLAMAADNLTTVAQFLATQVTEGMAAPNRQGHGRARWRPGRARHGRTARSLPPEVWPSPKPCPLFSRRWRRPSSHPRGGGGSLPTVRTACLPACTYVTATNKYRAARTSTGDMRTSGTDRYARATKSRTCERHGQGRIYIVGV